MLNVDRGSVDAGLPRRSLAVGDPVHSEDVSVIGDHLMGLHGVALFADHERLENSSNFVVLSKSIPIKVLRQFVLIFLWGFCDLLPDWAA